METYSYKSVDPGGAAKEENKDSKSNGNKESSGEDIVLQVVAGKIAKNDYRMKQASPNQMNLTCSKQLNEQLESAKSEMDEAMEENQRLKMYLDQILKDYRTLQKQYQHVVQQEAKTCPDTTPTNHDQTEESELIALSLGRSSSGTMKGGRHKLDEGNKGLKLQLDCEFQVPKMLSRVEARPNSSPENILEEVKEKKKNVKDGGDDEISLQNPAKRARVSVRIRCDTPTINDGCQWRKYGQKFTKGSPCPRAYYRCTVAPSCPVRKQVQRCAEDMSILVAMYEGTHNHPLAVSAQAMAATTSAAAAMLLSGSLTSASSSSSTTTITTANLNGLNFSLSDNSRPMSFYLPNSSISSYPTITLDLTSTSCLSSSSFSSHLSQLGCIPPRYHFNPLESSSLPNCISLSNEILSYETQPCHRSQSNNFLSFGKKPIENFSQSYPRKNSLNSNQQTLAPETIAAATKAITSSNPSFQYALVAALSSIMGSGGANNSTLENQELIKESTQNIK